MQGSLGHQPSNRRESVLSCRPTDCVQRTFDIWSFALNFFWRLWLVNQKFMYGKEGMTPPRVSQRRAELVRTATTIMII